MLEAVITTDLVSPSAWSAAPKNLQLSTSWAGRLPHLLKVGRTCRAGAITSGFDPTETSATTKHISFDRLWRLSSVELGQLPCRISILGGSRIPQARDTTFLFVSIWLCTEVDVDALR